jgi:ribonuclease-3
MSSRDAALSDLERRLGYTFKDRSLLDRATTHASVGEGARTTRRGRFADNERLEFLGDRVLGLLTAEALLEDDEEAPEGALALRLNALVNRDACAEAARRINLGEALRLSPSETRSGGRGKASILADACEAVMAALFLDGGLEASRGVFRVVWAAALRQEGEVRAKDAKTALQEQVQSRGKGLPRYVMVAREGPDHEPVFTIEAQVEGLEPATGRGASRQAAEKAAAQTLLERDFTS